METKVQCVKIKNIRALKKYDPVWGLREWLENPDNVYVGRLQRTAISKDKKHLGMVFAPNSKWGNPYSVGDPKKGDKTIKCTNMKVCLNSYIEHLIESGLIRDIHELRGKTLGCWCEHMRKDGVPNCHAQVLADLANKCYHLIENIQNNIIRSQYRI